MVWLMAAVVGAIVGAGVLVSAAPVLGALRLPAGLSVAPWAHLPTRRWWLTGVGVASGLSSALVVGVLPLELQPLWLVWTGPVALLVAVDAATTWLPLRLTQGCWLLCALAVPISLGLGLGGVRLVIAVACAVGTTFVLWMLWWIARGGLGFGDVRLAPMLGICSGSLGWQFSAWSLLLASLVGVLLAVAHRVRRQPGGFAYAPALWSGPLLCLAAIPGTA